MKNMYDGHHVEHINSSELEETDGNITEEDMLEIGNTVRHIVDIFETYSEFDKMLKVFMHLCEEKLSV